MTQSKEMIVENFKTKKYAMKIAKVIMGVIAIFAGAQIIIPIQPVPIKQQRNIPANFSENLSFNMLIIGVAIKNPTR